jgi:murein DD-endopeptidase MepM/ murein hydrolase activator NlpD
MLIIFIFVVLNIYVFFAYSTQIWQISSFQRKISLQNQMITKLTAEKSQVMPILNRSRYFQAELAHYRLGNQAMISTWNRLRQKGNFRFNITSRGFFNRANSRPLTLNPVPKSNMVTTSLDQLNHNLDQLEPMLAEEVSEQQQLLQDLKAYERRLDHMPSIWPVYAEIASPFGTRFHPIYRKYIVHEGVDLAAEYGTKVRASADGIVSFAGWEEGYGLMVKINHDYGYETYYGHNSRLLVSPGEAVKKGQIICLSGNSGESTGPHVHYEVRRDGKPINPVPFLRD